MEDINEELLTACDDDSKKAVKEVKKLVRKGANVNYTSDEHSPLSIASFHGNEKSVSYLLEKGADPTFINKDGESALYECIQHYTNVKVIKMLLDAGTPLHVKVFNDKEAIHWNKSHPPEEHLKTNRTLLTKIEERVDYFKDSEKAYEKEIVEECFQILDIFNEHYEKLLDEDKKIIHKYRLRRFFKMI